MTKDRTVLVVTSGSYSDYKILGVYDDQEIADQAIKRYNSGYTTMDGEASIETWSLNRLFNGQQTRTGYHISAYTRTHHKNQDTWTYHHHPDNTVDVSTPTVIVEESENSPAVHIDIYGRDQEHAERVLLDTIKMIEAKKAGLT